MSLYGLTQGVGPSGFGYNSTAEDVTAGMNLAGRTYLVTGCGSGLGTETLRVLRLRGARVLASARSLASAQAAINSTQGPGEAIPVACELAEPASVRAAVAEVKRLGFPLDGIIANAGIMALPKRQLKHGVEEQLFTNHVGHFLLVTGLLGQLTPAGRVTMLSSAAHKGTYPEGVRLDDWAAERGYTAWGAYGQSKLCNMLFARHLGRVVLQGAQTANAVHPGVIATNLGRHMPNFATTLMSAVGPALVLKTIPQGAATQLYVATHDATASARGLYFSDNNITRPSRFGEDDALAAAVWKRTEELVATL